LGGEFVESIGRYFIYEGYPENKFRLQILPVAVLRSRWCACVPSFLFFVKAQTQFADI